MLDAILFDLDGTLLCMDNDEFVRVYFGFLAKKAAGWGYTDSRFLIKTIWDGVAAMIGNDGSRTNCKAFWECFAGAYGEGGWQDMDKFNSFYMNEFNLAKDVADLTKPAGRAVELAHQKADQVVLATNPIFPRCAVDTRLAWLGLTTADFNLVTDYENFSLSKPNPDYFRKITEILDLDPGRCIMIGNDVEEDVYAAREAGIAPWLVTDFMINRKNLKIDVPCGSYEEMIGYLEQL